MNLIRKQGKYKYALQSKVNVLTQRLINFFKFFLKLTTDDQSTIREETKQILHNFLDRPSLDGFGELIEECKETPLLDVDLEISKTHEEGKNISVPFENIQKSLYELNHNILDPIINLNPKFWKGQFSFLNPNSNFVEGVSKESYKEYKNILEKILGSNSTSYLDMFYQILKLKIFKKLLSGEYKGDDTFCQLFRLIMNLKDALVGQEFTDRHVAKISSVMCDFLNDLGFIMTDIHYFNDDKSLFFRAVSKLLPPGFLDNFIFKNIGVPNILFHAFLLTDARLLFFCDQDFTTNTDMIHLFSTDR